MGDAETVVALSDEFKMLARDRLPTMDPPRDSYDDLVASDTPSGYYPFNDASLTGNPGDQLVADTAFAISNDSPIVGDYVGSSVTAKLRGRFFSLTKGFRLDHGRLGKRAAQATSSGYPKLPLSSGLNPTT